METEFIQRLEPSCLQHKTVSVLDRETVWHEFAKSVQDALEQVHSTIDVFLQRKYMNVKLTPQLRNRIEYLVNHY